MSPYALAISRGHSVRLSCKSWAPGGEGGFLPGPGARHSRGSLLSARTTEAQPFLSQLSRSQRRVLEGKRCVRLFFPSFLKRKACLLQGLGTMRKSKSKVGWAKVPFMPSVPPLRVGGLSSSSHQHAKKVQPVRMLSFPQMQRAIPSKTEKAGGAPCK